jgi:hypothetical protein
MLINPTTPNAELLIMEARTAAAALGLPIDILTASDIEGIDDAFASLARSRPDGLMVTGSNIFNNRRVQVVALLDASGKEQLHMSRLAMDVVGSNLDLSGDPKFVEAVAHKSYYGPVYFRRESAPYMTLALAGTRRESGVSVAEVSLKLVWDLIWQLKVGEHGLAYLLDSQDHVIVHSAMFTPPLDGERAPYHLDLSLFQRDFSGLPQVQAAHAAGSGSTEMRAGRDISGREVLSAFAGVSWPGWHVFVELPVAEADTAIP